ncbi:hypothetical protein JKP88DRAFT_268117 [Tribonema minus]|uniref:Uncharacterized protein n=1 Tax=Tribonema minus TaxID=303371 RepID=A0A836CHQ8_9STRA|nr:hypothetical protein JKP88DRAFT_268117 [Tribonema minus]
MYAVTPPAPGLLCPSCSIQERFAALEGSDALTAIVESTLDSYTEVAKERRATYPLTEKNEALRQQLREQRRKESNEKRSGDFEKRMENKLDALKDELTAAMNQQSAELTKNFEYKFAESQKGFQDKFILLALCLTVLQLM